MVRRQEQSEATAARVLDAAWERFSTLPYVSVRLSDIAGDAGVSVQTLHIRFGTKEDLFTVAFRRWMAEQGARRVAARVGDVEDIVRVLYDNYDDQGEVGLRMMAQEDRIPAIRTDTDAGRLWHRRWVGEMFAPFLDAARADDRADLHDALIVACDIHTWKVLRVEMGRPTGDARRIAQAMISAMTATAATSSPGTGPPARSTSRALIPRPRPGS